ncbi:MAG: hypothetical protein IKQ35_02435 [Bacilli bacterium]|nr:hypothetical protein [Bacilli bacterium]
MKKIRLLFVLLFALLIVGCSSNEEANTDDAQSSNTDTEQKEEVKEPEQQKELTKYEKTLLLISDLFDKNLAYDAGDYIKGDIPKGEYAFVKFEGS